MASIEWDPKAGEFLKRLQKVTASRIFRKIDEEVKNNVKRYLETLVGMDGYKIRVGDYRLFVDYYGDKDHLVIRTIRHRRDAYKIR